MKSLLSRFTLLALSAPLVLSALPAAAQFGEPADFQVTPQERTTAINGALTQLNEVYVFPETAKKMEAAVRARAARGEYASVTSARELAHKLTDDLRDVCHDKHLDVMYFPEGVKADPGEPFGDDPEMQMAYMRKVNFGFEKVERLEGNVGYLEIRGFVPASKGAEVASAAMSFLANADALIIDLRRNGGGEPSMIAYLQSYLFDEQTHLNDIWERQSNTTQQWWTMPGIAGPRYGGKKPIYVLTSNRTFSGGEEFAYNLKSLKRATVIGETTGGGAHPTRGIKVSEHFAINVPYARAINPVTHTNWEGEGVKPDVPAAAADALNTAYRLALEKRLEVAPTAHEKEIIQHVIKEFVKK